MPRAESNSYSAWLEDRSCGCERGVQVTKQHQPLQAIAKLCDLCPAPCSTHRKVPQRCGSPCPANTTPRMCQEPTGYTQPSEIGVTATKLCQRQGNSQ